MIRPVSYGSFFARLSLKRLLHSFLFVSWIHNLQLMKACLQSFATGLLFLLPVGSFAQLLMAVSPSTYCTGNALKTGVASVNTAPAGTTSFSWSITNPAGPNNASTFTVLPATPSYPSNLNTSFSGCGVFTITCVAYNGALPTATAVQTIDINCLSVSPLTQTLCAGAGINATITAFGAGSYSWSTGSAAAAISPLPANTQGYSVYAAGNPSCTLTSMVYVKNLSVASAGMSVCVGSTALLTASGALGAGYTWTGSGISQPLTQPAIQVGPGSYTVSSPATNGNCTQTITLGIQPPLTITISQSSATTCIINNAPKISEPVVLSASGASSYTWNPVPVPSNAYSIAVTPTVTTCYTVQASTAVCSGSAVACVSVSPQFTVATAKIPNVATICRFQSLVVNCAAVSTLAAGPASAFVYKWGAYPNSFYGGTSAPTATLYPMVSSIYSLEVFDAAGCVSAPATSTILVAFCNPNSLKEENAEQDLFALYPNPVKNLLFMEAKVPLTQDAEIEISDLTGKTILKQPLLPAAQENTFQVDLGNLRSGVYVFLIKSPQGVQRGKWVKE